MTFKFEDETTTTVGQLREGDFLCTVPTQERIRGTRFDSGVKTLTAVSFKQGRSKVVIPGHSIKTLREHDAGMFDRSLCYPDHFTCTVRRMIREGE